MYDKIVNPKTGIQVSIFGKIGQKVLKNYTQMLTGGASVSRKWTYGRLNKVEENITKIINCDKFTTSDIVSECGVSVLELIEIKKCFKWIEKIISKSGDKSLDNQLDNFNILINNLDEFINTITRRGNKVRGQKGGMNFKKMLLNGLLVLGYILTAVDTGFNSSYQNQFHTGNSTGLVEINSATPISSEIALAGVVHHNATHDVWCYGDDCLIAPSEEVDRDFEDFCRGNPTICSGNLKIPRKFMPQIRTDGKGGFKVGKLVDKIISSSGQKLAKNDVYDKTADVDNVKLDKIKPIQNEAWEGKVTAETPRQGQKFAGMASGLENAFITKGATGVKKMTEMFNSNPVLVVRHRGQDYLLDGHHRFFSFKKHNSNAKNNGWGKGAKINKIPVRRINLPDDVSPLDVVRISHDLGESHKNLLGRPADVTQAPQPVWTQ